MALITCKDCSQEVSTDATNCPQCGARTKSKSNIWLWVLGVPIGLFALLLLVGTLTPTDQEKQQARRIYDGCISDMKDELRSRDFRDASRYMCERLRDDFVKKYGHAP